MLYNYKYTSALSLFVCAYQCLLASFNVYALPISQKLIGGSHFSSENAPFAVVSSSKSICSGTLISSRLVLTAAHCINDSAANFSVIINNQQIGVKEVYSHNDFYHDSEYSLIQASNDLGIIILEREVLDLSPISIVYNLPVDYSKSGKIVGFGSNENSASSKSPLDNARFGTVNFSNHWAGLLYFDSSSSKSSLCAGDSGGALVQTSDDGSYQWLIGVNVAGTNKYDDNGNCVSGIMGTSYAVSLLSPNSVKFLRNFEGINYINGSDTISQTLEGRIREELIKFRHEQSPNGTKLELKKIKALIRRIRPLLSEERRSRALKLSILIKKGLSASAKIELYSILKQSNNIARRFSRPLG